MTLKEKIEEITYYYSSKVKDWFWNFKCFCRNIKNYWGILWKDCNFDYYYLEDLILHKLVLMSEYFKTARIAYDSEKVYHQINFAIRIGNIAFKDKYEGQYVNLGTYKKYFPFVKETEIFDDYLMGMFKEELRRAKAKRIFYKILERYSQTWWD